MSENKKKNIFVSPEELDLQKLYINKIKKLLAIKFPAKTLTAFVHTYGCQGNVADTEKIKGMLSEMGYEFASEVEGADLVLYNTCAVREHAEYRVFGNVGALKHNKRRNPNMKIALCGCMMQQEQVAEKIRKSFPYVDLVFGTHVVHKFPELLYNTLHDDKRVFALPQEEGTIAEGIPSKRDGEIKAWLSVMYGCNNFCSYCIVPYVRGRERSRTSEDILKEAKELVKMGYKEISLLGQNVNSYGKGLDEEINFAKLLRMINAIEGDFNIRFMTSHPKDCTVELLDAMAECEKVCKHLHLPFQSGNNRVLKEMNRGYTREKYLSLIEYARKVMPEITFTSDVIVGFPGETYEEFLDTIDLIKQVKFISLYTFIYSPRKGTPAAVLPDPISREEKGKWFKELLDEQEKIASCCTDVMLGKKCRVLVENKTEKGRLFARTEGNLNVEFDGDESLVGTFVDIEITVARTWVLNGKLI